MLPVLAFSFIFATSPDAPPAGGYGFNWLEPASECRLLSAEDLAKASSCEVSENAFGIELEARTCKVSAKVEWVVYDTAEHCQQAWETMQANGD